MTLQQQIAIIITPWAFRESSGAGAKMKEKARRIALKKAKKILEIVKG